jgi:hypothetical protein
LEYGGRSARHRSCGLPGSDDADLRESVENVRVLMKSGSGEWKGVDGRDSGSSDGDRVGVKPGETGDQ